MPTTRKRSTARASNSESPKKNKTGKEEALTTAVKKEIKHEQLDKDHDDISEDVENMDIEKEEGEEYDEEEDDVMDYMRRREENVRMNKEFLAKLGMDQGFQTNKQTIRTVEVYRHSSASSAKFELHEVSAKPKSKAASQRGLKREKRVAELLPRRSSLRLQNKTPEGIELPPEALIRRAQYFTTEPVSDHSRPPDGPLVMKDILYSTCTEDDHENLMKIVNDLDEKPYKPSTVELDRFVANIKKTKITEKQVVHAVKDRSFSVGFHPCATKILAASGDKWGRLGIWDVMYQGDSKSDGVTCYVPHSRPITCLEFPVESPNKIYSCGYDGSLRCGDLVKEVFEDVYHESEDDDILLRNFSFNSPHTMLVSQNTGCVSLIDLRTPGTEAEHTYQLHPRSLRTVSVHPVDKQYFCTGGVEGKLSVWDMRNVKVKNSKPLCELSHGKSINSAYFSPITGKYILSTSMDDKLTIFDSSVIGSNIRVKKSMSHNNHTGRWLTGFRASWHPAREDIFVVGSMNKPREISLFGLDGRKLHSFLDEDNLRSVCSLNAFHPTLNMVVGANSSGRLHLFM